MTNGLAYELEPIKATKKSNIKLTKQHQAIKVIDELSTLVILRELLVRHWVLLLAVTFILENVYIAGRYLGLIQ